MANAGLRYNADKPRMDLLPWDALRELANHYLVGSYKYAARNWENGLKWNEECAASLQRHLGKWSEGEDYEYEEIKGKVYKVYHDVAIVWNAVAILTFRLRSIGKDDRHKTRKNPESPPGFSLLT